MKKSVLLLVFFVSTLVYSQTEKYIDDFGNPLSEVEFQELKNNGAVAVRFAKNNQYKKGVIPIEFNGRISDSLKFEIVHFLELNSKIKISQEDILIIDYAIDHRCNVVNSINYKLYLETIIKKENLLAFMMVDNYNEHLKHQMVDDTDIIKSNFFNYINWDLKDEFKCGGVLLINPDNSFFRIYGEYNPMDIFEKIK